MTLDSVKALLEDTKGAASAVRAVVPKVKELIKDGTFEQYAGDMARRAGELDTAVHSLNNLGMVLQAAIYLMERM